MTGAPKRLLAKLDQLEEHALLLTLQFTDVTPSQYRHTADKCAPGDPVCAAFREAIDHLIWATQSIGDVAAAVRKRRRLPPPEHSADVRLRRRLELPDEEGGGDPRLVSDTAPVERTESPDTPDNNNDAVIGRLTEAKNNE